MWNNVVRSAVAVVSQPAMLEEISIKVHSKNILRPVPPVQSLHLEKTFGFAVFLRKTILDECTEQVLFDFGIWTKAIGYQCFGYSAHAVRSIRTLSCGCTHPITLPRPTGSFLPAIVISDVSALTSCFGI